MSDLSSIVGDLDRLMEMAQREAEKARDQSRDPSLEASGSALDGKVSLKLAADGRMSELVLDDHVMALTPRELAVEIMSAFNQAWAASRSSDPAAAAAAAVDPAALAETMKQIREEGVRTMSRITDTLADQMAKIDRRLS
ncbi:DNA-binding protein YbaB [Hamadaea flava]|uniref:YbaB/EbfC family nucleoid-associated protein n=1 Tax=Hamadaea flava TaxID=1742688 RepID=A0ABV8LJW1_9ACTN|nr:YbaB/EbfC family nucleoid-associated protein [Hamadaea flava]MCP2325273.1 DNA-binding protein YbaB [Hamadaea flava]